MTPEDHQELRQCSERIAQLLYQEACEQGEHVTFADESERVEDMAIECPVSP
jgi:dipeptidase